MVNNEVTDSFSLLGVRYNNLTVAEALDRVVDILASGRKTQVCFLNLDCIRQAQEDPGYRVILNNADLVLSDGVGLRLLTQAYGGRLRANCNGTDLSPKIMKECADRGYSVFFLGGVPGVAEKAAENVRRRFPQLKVAGTSSGYFDSSIEVVNMINASGADVLFVAMGVPLQEKWIAGNLGLLSPRLCLGVGALLDYLSDSIPRAPRWMIRLHIEWLWRILIDPKRMIMRYLVHGLGFLTIALCKAWISRLLPAARRRG